MMREKVEAAVKIVRAFAVMGVIVFAAGFIFGALVFSWDVVRAAQIGLGFAVLDAVAAVIVLLLVAVTPDSVVRAALEVGEAEENARRLAKRGAAAEELLVVSPPLRAVAELEQWARRAEERAESVFITLKYVVIVALLSLAVALFISAPLFSKNVEAFSAAFTVSFLVSFISLLKIGSAVSLANRIIINPASRIIRGLAKRGAHNFTLITLILVGLSAVYVCYVSRFSPALVVFLPPVAAWLWLGAFSYYRLIRRHPILLGFVNKYGFAATLSGIISLTLREKRKGRLEQFFENVLPIPSNLFVKFSLLKSLVDLLAAPGLVVAGRIRDVGDAVVLAVRPIFLFMLSGFADFFELPLREPVEMRLSVYTFALLVAVAIVALPVYVLARVFTVFAEEKVKADVGKSWEEIERQVF